jgi:hypothetical protein
MKPDPRQRRLREVPIEDLAEQVGVRRAAVRLGEDDPVVDRSEPTDHPLSSCALRHARNTATVLGSRSIVRRPVAVFTSSTIIS